MKKEFIIIFFLLICLFLTGQQPSRELGQMPDAVFETSGMIFYNGKLITHNDSGNSPQLFEIDTVSLEVSRTITLTNVENNDWEDIAQDELYLYIGDFGNNLGARKDLAIYRILKTDYNDSNNVKAETINFSYEDQVDFMNSGNSDWDAEALFVIKDRLIILTKQWQSQGTIAYSLPKTPGNYIAEQLDSYDAKGFITGATYNPITENLHVIGYDNELRPFFIQVNGADKNAIFGGEVNKTDFEINQAQVESITYVDANTYFFSSEFFTVENLSITLPSLLYSFTIDEVTEGEEQEEQEQEEEHEVDESTEGGVVEEIGGGQRPPNPETEPKPEEFDGQQLVLYRPFGSDILQYRLNVDGAIFGMAIFDASGRLVANLPYKANNSNSYNISTLENSIYYLTFFTANGVVSKPFTGR